MLPWFCLGRNQGSERPARKALHSCSEPWNVTLPGHSPGEREQEQGAALCNPSTQRPSAGSAGDTVMWVMLLQPAQPQSEPAECWDATAAWPELPSAGGSLPSVNVSETIDLAIEKGEMMGEEKRGACPQPVPGCPVENLELSSVSLNLSNTLGSPAEMDKNLTCFKC